MEEEQEQERQRSTITSIFHRLPVKTLLRCRCLSQSHMAIIDDPNFSVWYSFFSAKHVTRSRRLFLKTYPPPEDADSAAAISSRMGFCSFSNQTYSDQADLAKHSVVGGSCMGILCVAFSPFDVCLWNPSTRTHSHLIPPNYEHHSDEDDGTYRYVSFGLGVDGNASSKLVRLVFSFLPESGAFFGEASVYSLRTSTWETIESKMTWPAYSCGPRLKDSQEIEWQFGKSGVPVLDRLNWVVRHYGILQNGVEQFTILTLNLDDYSFSTESVPEFMMEGRSSDSLLDIDVWPFNWEDSLSLYFCSKSSEAVIWVREMGRWKKMLTVEGFHWRLKPLFYAANDKKMVLLQMDSKVVWYDLRTGRYWVPRALEDESELYEATVYLESCELINGGERCPQAPYD